MDDCPNCPKLKATRIERSRHSHKKRRYRPVSERKRRYSPIGCEGCSREELRLARRTLPYYDPVEYYPSPCRGTGGALGTSCYPKQTESGLLNTIRSSILRIFTGRKPNNLYMYSMSQLKFIEQLLDKLEDETCCIESTIKQGLVECECDFDCNSLNCSLNFILERVEGVKYDLLCARDCYDPCRDRCEFEFICCLMERVSGLEAHIKGLHRYLEYHQEPSPCDAFCAARTDCKPKRCCGSCKSPRTTNICPKPCGQSPCCKLGPETGCRTVGFDNSKCCGTGKLGRLGNIYNPKELCRTSSVIPVGVMLVKL